MREKVKKIIQKNTPIDAREWAFAKKYIWQHQLEAICSTDADDRSIICIVDPQGGTGKSQWAKWMATQPNVCHVRPKKKEGLRFNVDNQRIIIVDVPRAGCEFLCWDAIEELKDGIWDCDKYEGKRINRAIDAHVIIFLNQEPPFEKLS